MRHLNAPLSAGRDTLAVCPLWKADMLLLNALITTTNWRRGRYFVKFPKTSPSGLSERINADETAGLGD